MPSSIDNGINFRNIRFANLTSSFRFDGNDPDRSGRNIFPLFYNITNGKISTGMNKGRDYMTYEDFTASVIKSFGIGTDLKEDLSPGDVAKVVKKLKGFYTPTFSLNIVAGPEPVFNSVKKGVIFEDIFKQLADVRLNSDGTIAAQPWRLKNGHNTNDVWSDADNGKLDADIKQRAEDTRSQKIKSVPLGWSFQVYSRLTGTQDTEGCWIDKPGCINTK